MIAPYNCVTDFILLLRGKSIVVPGNEYKHRRIKLERLRHQMVFN